MSNHKKSEDGAILGFAIAGIFGCLILAGLLWLLGLAVPSLAIGALIYGVAVYGYGFSITFLQSLLIGFSTTVFCRMLKSFFSRTL